MKNTKKQTNDLTRLAKDTVVLGATLGLGSGLLGTMSNIPGMPAQAQGTARIAQTGLTLVGTAHLAKVGMGVANMFVDPNGVKANVRVKKKSTGDAKIDSMLGL